MKFNMIGAFVRNAPFGSEIAYKKGLEKIGHEVFVFDPIEDTQCFSRLDQSPAATIIFKHADQFEERLSSISGPKIVYQPDDTRCTGIRDMLISTRRYCDYAFTFDKLGAEVAREIGYLGSKKLMLTADPDIYFPMNMNRDIDFSFVGNFSHPTSHASRRRVVEVLQRAGYNVFAGTIMNVQHVNAIYNRSKVVLNHATDVGQVFGTGYGYQCRHFEAGFAGACLLSNDLLDDESDGPKQYCTFDSEESLVELAGILCDGWYDGPIWEAQGAEFHKELLSSFKPEDRANDIVKFVESL